MTNREAFPARESIEHRLRSVSVFVDGRFPHVALVRLRAEMIAAFARLEAKIAANTSTVERLKRKLDQVIDGFNRPAQRHPRRSPKKH